MNLIEALQLYTHMMQQYGGDLAGRDKALVALTENNVPNDLIEAISRCVSNDGRLITADGKKYALTELSAS